MKNICFILLVCFIPVSTFAVPTISSVTGTVTTGQTLQVTGAGFGTKPRSKPLIWWDASNASVNPDASLSNQTAWSATQGTVVGTSGTRWGSHVLTTNGASDWGPTSWVFTQQILMPNPQGYGGKWRCNMYRRTTMVKSTITGRNIKPWRFYQTGVAQPTDFPNINMSNDAWFVAGNTPRWYTESNDPIITGTNRIYEDGYTPVYDGNWHFDDVLIQRGSSVGATNATLIHSMDNVIQANNNHYQTDYADAAGIIQYIIFQDVLTGSGNPGGDNYHEALYLDDSWNIVIIGNASTFAACTHLEVQPYTAWSDSSITLTAKLGTGFTGTAYLYVFDNSNIGSTGFALSGISSNNPPSNLAFSTSSTTSLTLTFTAPSPAPDSYNVQVGTASDFSGTLTSSNTFSLSAKLSSLSINTTYFARADSIVSGSSSAWTTAISSATLTNPPSTVASTWTLVNTSSLTINWSANSNPSGTTYTAILSTASDFTGTLFSSTTLNTNATMTGLSAKVTYFGEVKATNRSGIDTTFFSAGSTQTAAGPVPTITNITPSHGSGGTGITIAGTNFNSVPTITVGGSSCTSIVFQNSTSLACTVPAGTVGAQNVVVTNPTPDNQSVTKTGGFTYDAPPNPTYPTLIGFHP